MSSRSDLGKPTRKPVPSKQYHDYSQVTARKQKTTEWKATKKKVSTQRASFLDLGKKTIQNTKKSVTTSSDVSKKRNTQEVQLTYRKASLPKVVTHSTVDHKLNEIETTLASAPARRSSFLTDNNIEGTTPILTNDVQNSSSIRANTSKIGKTAKDKIKLAFNVNVNSASSVARFWKKSYKTAKDITGIHNQELSAQCKESSDGSTNVPIRPDNQPQHHEAAPIIQNVSTGPIEIMEPKVVITKAKSTNLEQANQIDPVERQKRLQQDAKKREERFIAARERREKLEQERMESVMASSWSVRLDKVQERAIERRRNQQWLIYTTFLSRLLMWQEAVEDFRRQQHKLRLQYESANKIINVMRRNYVLSSRRRILKAFHTISYKLILKLSEWRRKRRVHACNVILSFLSALEYENSITHGCLSIMAKGKKWIAYKHKVIKLQRFWRREVLHIDAQTQLLDLQWRKEQERLLQLEVDKLHKMEELEYETEAKMIQAANQTRRAMNMKLLPMHKQQSKDWIRKGLLDELGSDILTASGIIAIEIRRGILRESLRSMKYLFVKASDKFAAHNAEIISKKSSVRTANIDAIMKIGFAFRHGIPGKEATDSRTELLEPLKHKAAMNNGRKPHFSLILRPKTLERILLLAETYVNKVRNAWSPHVIDFALPEYSEIGREIGQIHHIESEGLALPSINRVPSS